MFCYGFQGGAIIDTMTLIKHKHGYGSYGKKGKEEDPKEVKKKREELIKLLNV